MNSGPIVILIVCVIGIGIPLAIIATVLFSKQVIKEKNKMKVIMNAKKFMFDMVALGYEKFGWSKLVQGQQLKAGMPWTIQLEGVATVKTAEGFAVQGDIVSVDFVAAYLAENPELVRDFYAVSPGGWPQRFTDQFNGGALTVIYTVFGGTVIFGIINSPRFLHVTNGQIDSLFDFPGRFVGAHGVVDKAIFEKLCQIPGLEGAKLTYPILLEDKNLPGITANRAMDLIVNDAQSNKYAALYIPPSAIDFDAMTIQITYDPPMPPEGDDSKAAKALRAEIKFLKSITTAHVIGWSDLFVLGADGLAIAGAARVLGAIDKGLLPVE